MNRARYLQILGVGPAATPNEIHDAYLDLVRIWHPDRFSSNPRLQIKVAEELRKINEAYAALRAERDSEPSPLEYPPSHVRSQSRRWPNLRNDEDRWFNSGGWPFAHVGYALIVAAFCAVPLLTAAYVIAQLRVPVLDFQSIMTAARPRILMPMAIADPSGGVQTAVENLTEWARGKAVDLWRPSNWHSTPPVIVAQPAEATSEAANRPGSKRKHAELRRTPKAGQPDAPLATDLEHGTELLVAGSRVGLGELRVVNNADREALVTMTRTNGTPIRGVFLKPHGDVGLDRIPIGVYTVHMELGFDLDTQRLHFRRRRLAVEPVGPLQFYEVRSPMQEFGEVYEIRINPH